MSSAINTVAATEHDFENRTLGLIGQQLDLPCCVLDASGACLTYNEAAWRLFCEGDGLFLGRGGRIGVRAAADLAHFKNVLDELARPEGSNERNAFVLTARRLGRLPLTVTMRRILSQACDLGEWSSPKASVLLFITDPEADIRQSVQTLCKMHGLTPAECRLAWNLVEGMTLHEAAAANHLKPATVRAYLKQIFAKMDVNRQTALIKLLLLSRPPVLLDKAAKA